jgi:hypothetical protein
MNAERNQFAKDREIEILRKRHSSFRVVREVRLKNNLTGVVHTVSAPCLIKTQNGGFIARGDDNELFDFAVWNVSGWFEVLSADRHGH